MECPEIRMMKFSNSGAHLLLSTVENCILILDAYDGAIVIIENQYKLISNRNVNSPVIQMKAL